METYGIENPHCGYGKKKYQREFGWNEGLENAVLMEQFEGVITTPQLSEPYGNQQFYTFTDPDVLVLYSEVAGEYFLLERCKEETKAGHPKWDEEEKQNLLAEIEEDVNREPKPCKVEKWHTKCKTYVSGTSVRISFGLKEHMEGEAKWNMWEVLLRFRRDLETGELYTYWGKLHYYEYRYQRQGSREDFFEKIV